MGAVARFTEQIVILTTPERASWIKEMKRKYGVSEAQVARDCIELGSESLEAHYAKLGIKHPSEPVKRAPRRARVSHTGAAPAAQFVAPAA
jgi:hypothetical protein